MTRLIENEKYFLKKTLFGRTVLVEKSSSHKWQVSDIFLRQFNAICALVSRRASTGSATTTQDQLALLGAFDQLIEAVKRRDRPEALNFLRRQPADILAEIDHGTARNAAHLAKNLVAAPDAIFYRDFEFEYLAKASIHAVRAIATGEISIAATATVNKLGLIFKELEAQEWPLGAISKDRATRSIYRAFCLAVEGNRAPSIANAFRDMTPVEAFLTFGLMP